MKPTKGVVQAVGWYPPYHSGGTEIYVQGLVRGLTDLGVQSTILIPRHMADLVDYEHEGVPVKTYPAVDRNCSKNRAAGEGPPDLEMFKEQLRKNLDCIYHQHSWIPICGLDHLRAAKHLGFRTVLTVHVAGNVCLRGTMLRYGRDACTGHVDERLCAACWAQSRGAPPLVGNALSRLPLRLAKRAKSAPGRLATALSARALAVEHFDDIKEMIRNADRIIAVCGWLYEALAENGVPKNKLALCRHGVSDQYVAKLRDLRAPTRPANSPLRLLFLGRWDSTKGLDTVVQAVRLLSSNAITLSIRALPAERDMHTYESNVRKLAFGDSRVKIEDPIDHHELATTIASYDVLLVPSKCLETGPLVVLEAQAAGLFILGAALGGISELLANDDNAELIQPGNAAAWAAAISRLADRHHMTAPLSHKPRNVRTMSIVASEMTEIYQSMGG
jgi:glycosyltransferase involved in cell wall biosynthesis